MAFTMPVTNGIYNACNVQYPSGKNVFFLKGGGALELGLDENPIKGTVPSDAMCQVIAIVAEVHAPTMRCGKSLINQLLKRQRVVKQWFLERARDVLQPSLHPAGARYVSSQGGESLETSDRQYPGSQNRRRWNIRLSSRSRAATPPSLC